MKTKSKYAKVRHTFLYRWEDANGKMHVIRAKARVKHPSRAVVLTLRPEHVKKSIKREGVGDTANCTMAICASDHATSFPHAVEGHIDWTYTRAFVVSKVNRDGLPTECYVYDHRDDIARFQDTAGGQTRLLSFLEKMGERQIVLFPKRIRSKKGRPGKGRKGSGARDVERRLRGGRLRYAVAQMASDRPGEALS